MLTWLLAMDRPAVAARLGIQLEVTAPIKLAPLMV